MRDARRAAEYLFDEIGGIDDSFIAAAQSARPARRYAPRRIAVLAAAVAAVIMLFAVTVPLYRGGSVKDDLDNAITSVNDNQAADNIDKADDLTPDKVELEALLAQTGNTFAVTEQIDLFDGAARLIWQTRESGEISAIKLSTSELGRIKTLSGDGERVEGGESDILVWISYGNGQVVSPYLEASAGNIGYGSLFDYLPEIIPTDELTGYIGNIITKYT
ncbi:MAG: hypothetical protein IJY27_00860 [Clostridia bacterium]|nr:hypothetical protein [Clostridia bacterium]